MIGAETVRLCDYMHSTIMVHIIVQRVIVQRIRATSCHSFFLFCSCKDIGEERGLFSDAQEEWYSMVKS